MSAARERNVELARAGLEAFDRGDAGAVLAFLEPDVETHVSPAMVNAGTWRGHDGYRQMSEEWTEAWVDHRMEIREVVPVDDRHVLAVVHQTAVGRGSGVPVEMDAFFIFEVVEGRARRLQIHPDRDSALAAI